MQALSEYQARRARLGFVPPLKIAPLPKGPLRISVYAEPIGPVNPWRTVYAEPAGPPRITSPKKRAQFILNGMAGF